MMYVFLIYQGSLYIIIILDSQINFWRVLQPATEQQAAVAPKYVSLLRTTTE